MSRVHGSPAWGAMVRVSFIVMAPAFKDKTVFVGVLLRHANDAMFKKTKQDLQQI